jgi:hypothetical protein
MITISCLSVELGCRVSVVPVKVPRAVVEKRPGLGDGGTYLFGRSCLEGRTGLLPGG